MEQSLSSLNLTTETYEALKNSGYNNLNELTDDDTTEYFDPDEWKHLTYIPKTLTALDLYQEQSTIGTIYTFDRNLDTIFEGEILPGRLLELCGEAGSGKTQICFQLCVNVQFDEMCGGIAGEAVYICTNHNFSKNRLQEVAQELIDKISNLKYMSMSDILKNIHHFKVSSYEEMFSTVVYLEQWLENHKVRLVVIDSVTAVFQQIDVKDRRHLSYKLLADLQELAVRHKFVVILTNNMTVRVNSSTVYNTPALGENYFHRINTRIFLERLCDDLFSATIVKSALKPEMTVNFKL